MYQQNTKYVFVMMIFYGEETDPGTGRFGGCLFEMMYGNI